uniref:Uncharacterized protein n=1 Tax=Lygus hesperus TaxID=30085 RepID=A0A0K8SA09_LYGHE
MKTLPMLRCNETNVEAEDFRVWRNDVAIIHLSFAFHLDSESPKLGVINFKSENRDLAAKRLQRLSEFQTSSRKTVCIVVGWGRFVSIFPADTGIFDTESRDYPPSHDLLVSTVRLSPLSVCEKYCSENPMLCNLNKGENGHLVCAERTMKPFINRGKNMSHFPCMGTEGSP